MDLKEGQVLVHGDGFYEYETEDDLRNFVKDVDLIHYICMITRPGIEEFTTKLEFTHYKPLTSRNDLLSMRTLMWNGLLWLITSVPLDEKHFAEELLPLCGLRVANGMSMMFGAGCKQIFPITGDNIFTLENVAGHPVYRNDDSINQAMHTVEEQSAKDARRGKKNKAN